MKYITVEIRVPDEQAGEQANHEIVSALLAGRDGVQFELLNDERIQEIADGIAARAYHATVEGIVEDLKRAIADKEITSEEEAHDWLHETIDGHHDVIYTSCAMEVVRQSRNDGAYFEQFGDEGAVKDGAINWSALAYCALEADVQEAIGGELEQWIETASALANEEI